VWPIKWRHCQCPCVSWSLTSPFSTNMAISETINALEWPWMSRLLFKVFIIPIPRKTLNCTNLLTQRVARSLCDSGASSQISLAMKFCYWPLILATFYITSHSTLYIMAFPVLLKIKTCSGFLIILLSVPTTSNSDNQIRFSARLVFRYSDHLTFYCRIWQNAAYIIIVTRIGMIKHAFITKKCTWKQ